MGEHDQAVPQDEDAHEDIHDDGRRFRPLGIDENPDVDNVAFSDAQLTPVFRYSGDKLISDAIHVHIRPFHVTKWESLYSGLFGTGVKPTRFDDGVEPSFTPIIDESYRVVGHLGWINMSQICIFTSARGGAALDLQKAEKGRLAGERQRLLSMHDRDPLPAFPARRARPEPDTRFWADVRSGRDKDGSEEERHQKNFNFFLAAGGTALVGRAVAMDLWDSQQYEMYWIEGYRCLALVAPDGHLQGVLGVEKVHYEYESRNQRDLRLVLKVVDIALTIWMVIDLVTLPVALIRVGLWVAEQVEIRAIKIALNRAAKAALEAAAEEIRWTRSELDVKAFWDAAEVMPTRQFSELDAKQWTDKIARRMKQLGIPEKNIGSKVKKFEPGKPKTMTGISRDAEGFGDAFEPMGRKRGSNTRSFADQYQVEEGGISVQGSVFEPWKDFELWNNAPVDDRIDAIIAHEWMEFNGLSHWESVELIGQNLQISKKAKEILQFMKKMGKPRKAFTEFP